MPGRFRDGGLSSLRHAAGGLAGPRIDEVERIALEQRARASATASSASRAVCVRPSAASAASSSACTPSETRLTPAAR